MEQNIYKKNDIQQTEENPNRPKFTANFGKLNVQTGYTTSLLFH